MYVDVIEKARRPSVDLHAALDASGFVGTWSWSSRSDRCILDAGAAEVLAGDPRLAGRPVPLETAKARIHPEDQPGVFRHFRALRERGGLFVAQYRTVSPTGRIRCVLDRGRIEIDGSGRRTGRGIIIDVTEGSAEMLDAAASPRSADPLEAAVEHAIDCRDALEGVDDPELRLLVDMLLLRLGRTIAGRVGPGNLSSGSGARRGH